MPQFSALERAMFAWNDDPRRVHCSNCRFARIRGTDDLPMAYCTAGHGEPIPVERLVGKGGSGFRPAESCDDFMFAEGES